MRAEDNNCQHKRKSKWGNIVRILSPALDFLEFIRSIYMVGAVEKLVRSLFRGPGFSALLRKLYLSKYKNVNLLEINIQGEKVVFSTEDLYSKLFFFPRYAGEKLHEKPAALLLLSILKDAKCFVDVGTNLGWYTCLEGKYMPGGIVYGFEMDDLNYDLLRKNIAINGCQNVKIFMLL